MKCIVLLFVQAGDPKCDATKPPCVQSSSVGWWTASIISVCIFKSGLPGVARVGQFGAETQPPRSSGLEDSLEYSHDVAWLHYRRSISSPLNRPQII
jgi:hypothetical protein